MSSRNIRKDIGTTTLPSLGTGVSVFLFFAFALLFPHHAFANASVFVNTSVASCNWGNGACYQSSLFGVLAGPNDALSLTGAKILNDVGISSGGTISTSGVNNIGSSTVASVVDFSVAGTNSGIPCTGSGCNAPAGSSINATTEVWGGTQFSSSVVSTAYTQFIDLATYWNSHATTSLPTQALNGNWNIESTTSGGTGIHVYNASSGYTPTGNVTLGCGAANNNGATNVACNSSDLIVIIVPNGQTASILKNITFASASGLTDDQLLFVINSTAANALSLNGSGGANNITIHGDFFVDKGGGYTVGNGKTTTIDGRVFAGGDATLDTLTWNTGTTLADEPTDTPEPGTWAMMIGGASGLIWLYRRRRTAA